MIGAQIRRLKGRLASLRQTLSGVPGLALLSALMLSGFWLGGPGLLLVAGLLGPGVMALWTLASERQARPALDVLTGLPGADGLRAALAAALAAPPQGRRMPLCLVLRLDGFEELQARQGTPAGDRLLVRIADRLGAAVRDGDTVARLDGARFGLAIAAIPGPALEAAIQLAARLLATIAEPVVLGGLELRMTACAGFSLARGGESPQQLIDAAAAALAQARRQGPGNIRAHVPGAPARPPVTEHLSREVEQALETGAIQPFFQPQVSTDTGEVTGMEALARWVRPDQGTLLPGEFLPTVAAAGQMQRLTMQILSLSLSALCEWQRHGLSVPTVSVNLDEGDLSDPTLPDRVRWELDRWDLQPGRLIVEVLETVLASAANEILNRNLARLAEMGVGIDLDDFGTGSASLSAIRRFGVHRIKIDRSFVTRLDQDRGQQDMVAAILSMADRLGLPALAEGVETAGEHALLCQLGCTAVQGFAIAPPMPLSETFAWIGKTRESTARSRALGRKVV